MKNFGLKLAVLAGALLAASPAALAQPEEFMTCRLVWTTPKQILIKEGVYDLLYAPENTTKDDLRWLNVRTIDTICD